MVDHLKQVWLLRFEVRKVLFVFLIADT